MKVSVVIPNYNGEKFFNNLFDSLNADSDCIGEVIIVDNASADKSKEFIGRYKFNFPCHLIENSKNLGFAPAVNQGISKAKYEYVFLLNNDTQLKKGAVKSLLDVISADDKVFSCQAKMLQYKNKNLIDDAGDEYNLLGKNRGKSSLRRFYRGKGYIFSMCRSGNV